jgi:ribosomal protein S18 acetylase RimI-like enzyme
VTGIDVVTAGADDREAVLGILRSAVSGRGTGTWGSEFPDVVRDLPAGLVHLARLEGRPVATFVLRWSDELVWGPDDGQAGYLHRLATHPDVAGRGIGAQLIMVAADLTRERGRSWLRLDCDRDNQSLRAYYEALGFTYAGDVTSLPRSTRPGYRSASRYQRAIPRPDGKQEMSLRAAPLLGVLGGGFAVRGLLGGDALGGVGGRGGTFHGG